jgi:hypothetical protein
MCVLCKAASSVLDMLWEDPDVRSEFNLLGADLSELGPLTHEVFVPAYRKFKGALDMSALSMLDAQVTQDLLEPHYDKKTFREAWDEWSDTTRTGFVREQTEVKLAQLLFHFYSEDFRTAYLGAYRAYREKRQQST